MRRTTKSKHLKDSLKVAFEKKSDHIFAPHKLPIVLVLSGFYTAHKIKRARGMRWGVNLQGIWRDCWARLVLSS